MLEAEVIMSRVLSKSLPSDCRAAFVRYLPKAWRHCYFDRIILKRATLTARESGLKFVNKIINVAAVLPLFESKFEASILRELMR